MLSRSFAGGSHSRLLTSSHAVISTTASTPMLSSRAVLSASDICQMEL